MTLPSNQPSFIQLPSRYPHLTRSCVYLYICCPITLSDHTARSPRRLSPSYKKTQFNNSSLWSDPTLPVHCLYWTAQQARQFAGRPGTIHRSASPGERRFPRECVCWQFVHFHFPSFILIYFLCFRKGKKNIALTTKLPGLLPSSCPFVLSCPALPYHLSACFPCQ